VRRSTTAFRDFIDEQEFGQRPERGPGTIAGRRTAVKTSAALQIPAPPVRTEHSAKPAAAVSIERVTRVHHWTDRLFSLRTTRDPGLRFRNGQFVMIGLEVAGRPLLRAYSIASANYEDHLEFFSIKVADGALTSRLQHVRPGDTVLVGRKPVGTLVLDDLRPGRNLYLLATGTGLAPFLSIIKDPDAYERFEHVVLVHGVRRVADLAYREHLQHELPEAEFIGPIVREKLIYYPTVTREPFEHQGRATALIESGRLCADIGLPALDPSRDRVMLCGSTAMLADLSTLLEARGFQASPRQGVPGDYVVERAFVDR
jgi:ferredoxin--NADP+ reductase